MTLAASHGAVASRGDTLPVEVGLGFWNMQRGYTGPATGPAPYREAVREVQLAEQMGFDSVWVAEHHFSYDGYGPSPLTSCGFLAAATETISVGTCIMVLPLHDPARVAPALEALGSLAPGRFKLGVGLGYREVEFTTFDRNLKRRARIMEESLDALLESGALDGIELWFGGVSEAAFVRAARYGGSILLPPQIGPPSAVEAMKGIWEANLQPRAGQRPRVGLFLQAWPERDAGRAAALRQHATEEWRSYSRFFVEDPVLGASGADRDEMASQFASTAMIGPSAQITEGLLAYEAAGVDSFILWPRFGSMASTVVRDSIDELASEVAPYLRSAR